jgi:outer membrane protein OmpA-like peptidoglycan-associated protein
MKKLFLLVLIFGLNIATSSLLAQTKSAPKKAEQNFVEPKELAPAVQIYFDNNKREVKKEEMKKLDALVDRLKSIKEYRLVLTGHTDSTGNDEYNMELSRNRVDEVFDYLIEKDIEEEFIQKESFGRKKPREKNESDAMMKAKNRRVEITIIEKPKPVEVPKPIIKGDTCTRDTTVTIGSGMSITMNKCEYIRMCKSTPGKCVTIRKTSDIMEIIKSGHPLLLKGNEGLVWAGILEFKFPGDTCLSKPFTANVKVEGFDGYKKAKIKLYVKDEKTGKLKVSSDRDKKVVADKSDKKKESIKYAVTVKCPTSKDKEGTIFLAGGAGKGKTSIIKDKTGQIDRVFVIQEADPTNAMPLTIIEGEKKENVFTVKYGKLSEAQFIFQLNDGTFTSQVPVSQVKPTKVKSELRKKYKIKLKHLKD